MSHSINICFTTSNNLISRLIRWVTGSRTSHCFISYIDQTLKKVMIMEASYFGYRNIPWDVWKRGNKLVARYSLKNENEEAIVSALQIQANYLGTLYDYMTIVPFLFRKIWKNFKNPLTGSKKLFCSESVMMFLNDLGLADVDNISNWTPGDAMNYVQSHLEFFNKEE